MSKSSVKVKQENEIQSYITSFKEIEESEAPTSNEKTLTTENFVEIETPDEDFKYVFIVQDEDEEGGDDKIIEDGENQVYEFDEYEEDDIVEDVDEKTEKPKKSATKKIVAQPNSASYMCSFCNYSTFKRYLLARHMKCHSEDRPHKCTVCERGFKTIASLTNHINTHTGLKPHRCKFCDSAFTTSGELVRHVRYRHTHEKPHKCPECDYASVELSKLKRHIRCHTGERPYQCPHCTYASPDTFKLKRHLRIHTGEKPYQCDVCQARFTQSNSLKAHKLIHSVGEKPVFQCELCPTTCGRKTDLRIHVQKLHTSDQPIKCKRCKGEFPDRYSYKIHAKTHEGEKCYKCDLCLYASISARHLESHMLIHLDSKPYKCSYCDQTFRQKQLLKRHENIYHNPNYVATTPKEKTHFCPTCNKGFRHKGNLMRHMAQHESEDIKTEPGRSKIVHLKTEGGTGEIGDDYVVVEVLQDGTDIQYDDELELDAEEIAAEMEVDTENYTLSENIDSDVILTMKHEESKAPTSAVLEFNFSEDEDNVEAIQD